MFKKNKAIAVKDMSCLNCGHPFNGYEKFCPDCGQSNKGKRITLKSFISEVFAGFISWDAKFWRTIIPLLIKPGKVSKDYIEGKRSRYSNPFRFYITTSIIFFLIYGGINSYEKFQKFNNESTIENANIININKKDIDIDSLKNAIDKQLKNPLIPIDSLKRKEILNQIERDAKDTTSNQFGQFSFGGDSRIDKLISFLKRKPNARANEALDSLKFEKNFVNRFLYDRAKVANTLVTNEDAWDKYIKEVLSYGSISLFVFLPIFTLFFKLFYIRKKYTYVEHLIFVFHTQTVFFLLLTIYVVLDFFTKNSQELLFVLLFALYLFIAMKTFYKQGYFKTFIKFSVINFMFLIFATISSILLALITFAVI